MKHHWKPWISRILAVLLLVSLTACAGTGGGNVQNRDSSGNDVGQNTGEASTEKRTITDGVGRTVEIPATVETIVPLGNTPRMIVYLGLADRIVGIEECEIATSPIQAYAYPYAEAWSKLPNCGTNSMGETAYYPEEIMLAGPDVILCTDPADTADNLQTQTGIPVVSLSPRGPSLARTMRRPCASWAMSAASPTGRRRSSPLSTPAWRTWRAARRTSPTIQAHGAGGRRHLQGRPQH